MNAKKQILIFLVCAISMVSCNSKTTKGESGMENATVFEKGDLAPETIFTSKVWVKMLVTDEGKVFDTQVYNVTFSPSARTHWHSHPGGQILLATQGKGFYQEKGKPARKLSVGDVVTIPPDVVHWHGAAPKSEFVHIGLSTKVQEGPAKWLRAVTDQEYQDAVAD